VSTRPRFRFGMGHQFFKTKSKRVPEVVPGADKKNS